MDIKSAFASQGYAASRPATQAAPDGNAASLVGDFAKTVEQTEARAIAAMTTEADPLTLVQALADTQLAVETAVTVRDRVVEAYQEILRMPV